MLRRNALLIVLAVMLSGCLTHTYQVQGIEVAQEPIYDEWHTHLFGGLLGLAEPVDIQDACPAGVARIEDRVDPAQALLSVVTFFIYTPTRVRVWCSAS